MKFRILAIAGMLAALAAGSTPAQTVGPMVGGDVDAHGCRPSTGSTWSVLKQACIQTWRTGVLLLPLKPQGTATYTATVIFGPGRAELFVYDHKDSLMLQKAGGFWSNRWQGEGYVLTRKNGVFLLSGADGQLLYRERK